jgi:beta-lactamase regulating signal transducer with metallopeptidase domain
MTMTTLASYFPAIADTVAKATILLGLAWIAGLLLKNRSAALRHTMRACALGAVVLLPVFSYLVPAWHWQGLPPLLETKKQPAATIETPVALQVSPESKIREGDLALPSATESNHQPDAPGFSASRIAFNWPQLLVMLWLLGLGIVALRLLLSRSRFAQLVLRAAAVDDPSWHSQVQEIAHLLGIRRSVALLESPETEVPLASGAWHPKIVLSPDHAEWSPLRRNAILHHELAHIRRLDTLAQALCHVTIALYWFHPLVWLTVKAMRAEREQACDDYVLASGTKPSEYAHELLEIASSVRQPEFITALAMARRSQLEGRVMALLNPALRRESISQSATLTIVLLTLCAVLPLAAIQTATPPQKSPKPRTEATPKVTPSAPAANTEVEEPNMPEPPAPPAPPVAPPPVGGVVSGVPGGVKGGVPSGITGGVEAVPAMPAAPAAPQAVPPAPALPAAPRLPHPSALPKAPAAVPAPSATPRPAVAPVAPATPSTPPAGAVSPAPQANPVPRAASTAPVLAAIHAQAGVRLAVKEALRAKVAAMAATRSSERAAIVARIKAQDGVIAAVNASTSEQVTALSARIAASAANTAQTAATAHALAAVKATTSARQ